MVEDVDLQKDFFLTSPSEGYNLHGTVISFVCHSFFYSDYDWICRDIEFYSNLRYDENSVAQIKNNLNEIREVLAQLFLDIYTECLKKHRHVRVEQELCLVRSFLNFQIFEEYSDVFCPFPKMCEFVQDQKHYKKNKLALSKYQFLGIWWESQNYSL